MAYSQVDPAGLQGDALASWYQRSPDDIEQERRAAAAQQYDDFFGPSVNLEEYNSTDARDRPPDDGDDEAGFWPPLQTHDRW